MTPQTHDTAGREADPRTPPPAPEMGWDDIEQSWNDASGEPEEAGYGYGV